MKAGAVARIALPVLVGLGVLAAWEALVRWQGIPPYVLPGPLAVAQALWTDRDSLLVSWGITLQITAAALAAAAVGGLLLAVLFAQSRILAWSLFPYAIILQVTPVVAVAPLIIIWVDDVRVALLVCATIVAFFPVLSNTAVGLDSTDRNLLDLFRLYRASRWQVLWRLRLPGAMPFYLAGLRISGGLALIGAVVAEFVAGTGGRASGLAYRILEAGYQLQIPRMFAALVLVSGTGIAIFGVLSLVSHLVLRRWHESAGGHR